MTQVYAVMSHHKESYKFYEITSPALFFKLDAALKCIEEILNENHEEIQSDEGDSDDPGWLVLQQDLSKITEESIENNRQHFMLLSKDQMYGIWLERLNIN